MNIIIPVLQFGKSGGFRVLSKLADAWISKGHKVSFLSPIANIKPYFPTKAKIIWVDRNGDQCTEDEIIDEDKYVMYQRWKALYCGLNRLENSFDIALANHSLSTFPLFFSKIKAKKFYYIQAYEPEYYNSFGGIKAHILTLLSWISYFLKFSRIVNADLYKNYKNIRAEQVVYPGVDFDVFKPQPKLARTDKLILGSIGRAESYKGTNFVLDAFMLAIRKNPNVELHIAFGDLSLEKLHPNIKVVIPGCDRELGQFYNSLDILIAAGTVQLGAVHYPVIEAMACGIPVINTGYFPASVDNSWLVPIKDSKSIADQIFNIISNEEIKKQKIEKGFQDTRKFSWDIVSEKMYAYFVA